MGFHAELSHFLSYEGKEHQVENSGWCMVEYISFVAWIVACFSLMPTTAYDCRP